MKNYYEYIFNNVDSDVKELPSFLENKNILITGGSGFIGGFIVNYLCWIKHKYAIDLKIKLAIRSKSNFYKTLLDDYQNVDYLEVLILDLMNYEGVNNLNRIESQFDLIIHAASPSSGKAYSNNKEGTMFINTIIIDSLFKTLNKGNSIFMYFSTTGIYGIHANNKYPLREETFSNLDHLDSKNVYLMSKLTGETTLNTLSEIYEKRIIILRPSINYGPFLDPKDGRALSDFIVNALEKKIITIKSTGKSLRNYCFISDTLSGIFLALVRGEKNKVYNLAHDKETSILELATLISKKTDAKIEVQNCKDIHLGLDFDRTATNCDKLKSIGWDAKITLENGLESTIDYFKEYLDDNRKTLLKN